MLGCRPSQVAKVRNSVRSSNFFIREKHPKYRGNRVASACGYLISRQSSLSQAERTVTVGRHRIAMACAADGDGGDGCVCVCTCVYARVRVCMRDVFEIYDTILTEADNNNN